jgi:hypothetical protein
MALMSPNSSCELAGLCHVVSITLHTIHRRSRSKSCDKLFTMTKFLASQLSGANNQNAKAKTIAKNLSQLVTTFSQIKQN